MQDKTQLGKKYKLLLDRIIADTGKGSNLLFDTHDNCFQQSNRFISKVLNVPSSNVDRLIRQCIKIDLIRHVLDIAGNKRLMLAPYYMWFHSRYELPLAIFIYDSGDYRKAIEWRKQCQCLGSLIGYGTGEVIKEYFDWVAVDAYARSYSIFDRCKRSDNIIKELTP